MPSRFRKIRKLRGSRTCGYGRVGQHRKSGGRGGKGNAGLKKHKWTWTVKYDPDYFGKKGLKPPNRKIVKTWINIGQIDDLYETLSRNKSIESNDGKISIDLDKLGYDKLLGKGEIQQPYNIIVKSFTKKAKDKVEKAGGSLIQGKQNE